MPEKVPDGWHIYKWPEFQALLKYLDIPEDWWSKGDTLVTIHLYLESCLVSVRQGNDELKVKHAPTCGYGLYQSSEFRAFCQRSGIVWSKYTTVMSITVGEGRMPVVAHEYVLEDNKPVVMEEVDTPTVVKDEDDRSWQQLQAELGLTT